MDERRFCDPAAWIEAAGGEVAAKIESLGTGSLTALDKLIYCVWVAQHSMDNTGHLTMASQLYSPFQREGAALAAELGLVQTQAALALPTAVFEEHYLTLLSGMVDEIEAMIFFSERQGSAI